MEVRDYIQQNCPFYHITAKENVESIQNNGLLRKRCNAICVVRTDNPDVINEIATTQLGLAPGKEATIIKIFPLDHSISPEMIAADSVADPTAPLHNYIVTDVIRFSEEEKQSKEIFKDFTVRSVDLDSTRLDAIIQEYSLTGYLHREIPFIGGLDQIDTISEC